MKSARAGLSMAGTHLGKLIAADAPNYTSNFTASTLLFIVGTAALKLTDSPWLAYFSYALAIGEAAVGTKQWSTARFFAQKQPQPQLQPQAQSVVAVKSDASEEEFHPAPEHETAAVTKIKKLE